VTRHIDILHLSVPLDREEPQDGEEGQVLELAVQPKPSGYRHLLKKGRYQAHLALTARDVEVQHYVLEIEFDGTWWSDEQVWDHIRFPCLRPIRSGSKVGQLGDQR
jgi:hypothetical protein